MEENIHHAAVIGILAIGHAGKQFGQFGTDSRQAGDRRKKRIEKGWAHGRENALENACLARLTSRSFRPI